MSNNENDVSPIERAQSITPSWMMLINDFDGLEIHPCKIIGYAQDSPLVMTCKSQEASLWTVFGLYQMRGCVGGADALEKFPTEAEARRFHDRLLGAYPHLAGDRPHPRQQSKSELTP